MNEQDEWRPEKLRRDYPPPDVRLVEPASVLVEFPDPRDTLDHDALRRCVLEFEAMAARLRRLYEAVSAR